MGKGRIRSRLQGQGWSSSARVPSHHLSLPGGVLSFERTLGLQLSSPQLCMVPSTLPWSRGCRETDPNLALPPTFLQVRRAALSTPQAVPGEPGPPSGKHRTKGCGSDKQTSTPITRKGWRVDTTWLDVACPTMRKPPAFPWAWSTALCPCEDHRPGARWDLRFFLPEWRTLASFIRVMPMIAGNGEASLGPPEPGYLWDQHRALVYQSEAVGTITPSTVPVSSLSERTGLGRRQKKEHSPLQH